MARKLALLAVAAGALVTVVRRRRGRDDEDLWHEATSAIDLR
ncbi:MAG: DLW-39 family protein [Frankia sp.]